MLAIDPQKSLFQVILPAELANPTIVADFDAKLADFTMVHSSVTDFLAESIKSVQLPEIAGDLSEQRSRTGTRKYAPLYYSESKDLELTFRATDLHLNYWLLRLSYDRWLEKDNAKDLIGDLVFRSFSEHLGMYLQIKFNECVWLSLSSLQYDYGEQTRTEETFTVGLTAHGLEYELKQGKIQDFL